MTDEARSDGQGGVKDEPAHMEATAEDPHEQPGRVGEHGRNRHPSGASQADRVEPGNPGREHRTRDEVGRAEGRRQGDPERKQSQCGQESHSSIASQVASRLYRWKRKVCGSRATRFIHPL